MRAVALGFSLLAYGLTCQAQLAVQGIEDPAAERARIDDIRATKSAEFAAEDKACFDRFAVNPCRRDVERRRREIEAELKRQETALNDAERRKRGAEHLRQLDEKRMEREEEDARRDGIEDIRLKDERVQAQKDKAAAHVQKAAVPQARVPSESPSSTLDAQTIARNRAEYQKKQDAAEQRKRDREKNLKNAKPTAKSLPVPP